MIDIISSTRGTKEDFSSTPLGQSLTRLSDNRLTPLIRYENQRRWGISEVYNDQIDTKSDNDIIIFIHDDIWIDDDEIVEKTIDGLSKFDIGGLAGIRILPEEHVSWFYKNLNLEMNDPRDFSGRVTHFKFGNTSVDDYGPILRQCLLMDGLFFAARRSVLVKTGVRFDAQFRRHCYDLDFCRTANVAGLTMGTLPINVTHDSYADFDDEWRAAVALYHAKWKMLP